MARESKDTISSVRALLEPVIESMGKELVHLEFLQGHGRWILRLYVDRAKSTGITVDELTRVSRDVGTLLDVEDVIPGKYSLEVSSPGLNRPLGKIEDCDRFAGKVAEVITREPIQGRRKFKGILRGAKGESIVIEEENKNSSEIPWTMVKKANLEGELIGGEK